MADYAISNVPRRVVYAASGTGPYAFTFEILAASDIAVYKGDTLLTITTDYTVTINSNGTGSVTLVATAGTSNITIVGSKTIARTTDFTTGGDFFANTLNDELDAQTIFIQQVAETAERGMKAPVTDPTDINMTLPRKADRAGKYLAFDANGNPQPGDTAVEVAAVFAIRDEIETVSDNISAVTTVADDLNEDVSEINTVATNISNVNTVGGISANVTTVAGISAAVTSVAGNSTNINTVATNIANVNATGTNIANVNTVAGNNTNINTVAGQISPTNNVGTVAGISANVTTVAGISANVTTVATNNSNVSTVATNISNVNSVAGNIANVNAVAGNATNINAVNANKTNIDTVAGISANVTTVSGISGNVTTVASNSTSVNTVASNISNVNQVASDTVAINSASANATTATTKAAEALASANSASASAAAASAVALGDEPVRHSVRPSLLLDFANTKTLDPRITFTRASTGTFYDGKTVAKAEENLFTRSEEFNESAWVKNRVTVTTNATTAPDGTVTSELLAETAVNETHNTAQTGVATTSGAVFTFSIFVKKGTGASAPNIVQLTFSGTSHGTAQYANFDISVGGATSGTVTASAGGTATIFNAGNGWWKCVFSAAATATGSSGGGLFGFVNDNPTASRAPGYLGNTAADVFIWGAQLEQRSSVTAYTATTTAPITNYIPALQTAASGVARFDHNPVTGESLGLEIEEQRTNLLTYSDDFSNAAWIKTQSTITSNTIIAPDGALIGDKLVENTATAQHFIGFSIALAASTQYTVSVYAKAGERTRVQLSGSSGGWGSFSTAVFDLANGTVVTNTGSFTSASITPVGNGWYRCTATGASQASPITAQAVQVVLVQSGTTTSYTGDGYSGVYIWGAQLEARSFASSYIPTVASQVTRSEDSASMTGTNFSSWFRTDEGTLYVEGSTQNNVDAAIGASAQNVAPLVGLGDGLTNQFRLDRNDTGVAAFRAFMVHRTSATSATTIPIDNSYEPLTATKMAAAMKAYDYAFSSQGSAVETSNVPNGVIQGPLLIGQSPYDAGLKRLNGHVRKVAYYPARLTNEELQGLTTV